MVAVVGSVLEDDGALETWGGVRRTVGEGVGKDLTARRQRREGGRQ